MAETRIYQVVYCDRPEGIVMESIDPVEIARDPAVIAAVMKTVPGEELIKLIEFRYYQNTGNTIIIDRHIRGRKAWALPPMTAYELAPIEVKEADNG